MDAVTKDKIAKVVGAVFAVKQCIVTAYEQGKTATLEPVVFVHTLTDGEEKVTELDATPFVSAGKTGKDIMQAFMEITIKEENVVMIVFAAEGLMISGASMPELEAQVGPDGLKSNPDARDVVMIEVLTKERKTAFMIPLDKANKAVGDPVALAGQTGDKAAMIAALSVGEVASALLYGAKKTVH